MVGLWVILAIIAVLVIAFISMYNRFAHLRNEVKNAWAGIEVQLRRRHDLIPNLVETAKGYLKHEEVDRTYIYRPTISEKKVRQSLVGDLMDRLFEGSPSLLLTSLVEQNRIDEKELGEIKKLIRKKGKQNE